MFTVGNLEKNEIADVDTVKISFKNDCIWKIAATVVFSDKTIQDCLLVNSFSHLV